MFIYLLYVFNIIKHNNFLDKFLSEQSISIRIIMSLCIPLFDDKLYLCITKIIIILGVSFFYNKTLSFRHIIFTLFFVIGFSCFFDINSCIYILVTLLGLEEPFKDNILIHRVNTRSMARNGPNLDVSSSSQSQTNSNQNSNLNTERVITRSIANQASSENYVSAGDNQIRINTIIRRDPNPHITDSNATTSSVNNSNINSDTTNPVRNPVQPAPPIQNRNQPIWTILPPIDFNQPYQRTNQYYSHSGSSPQVNFPNTVFNNPIPYVSNTAPINSGQTENVIFTNISAYMDAFRNPANVQVNEYKFNGNNQPDAHKVAGVIDRSMEWPVQINPSVRRFYIDYVRYNHPGYDINFDKAITNKLKDIT